MRKPTRRSAIKPGPAAKALQSFITDNGIGIRPASVALEVSHPALIAWLKGTAKPKAIQRKKIEVWTAGKITESDWMTDAERAELKSTIEFRPQAGDAEPKSERNPAPGKKGAA